MSRWHMIDGDITGPKGGEPHIEDCPGCRIEQLEAALLWVLAEPRWHSIGSIDNTAELRRISRGRYENLCSLAEGSDVDATEGQT